MAILPALQGIEVTVQVDNQPLREYADDDVNETLGTEAALLADKTVSKYVESVTDAEFTVDLVLAEQFQPSSPSLTFDIFMDGKCVLGKVLMTTEETLRNRQTRKMPGTTTWDPHTKEGQLHHFRFANINTTSDDQKLGDIKTEIKRMSKVGMIEVKVFRTSLPITVPRQAEKCRLGSDSTEVHEKALKGKAKSHGVAQGRSSRHTMAFASKVEYLDGLNSPIANFVFQYRSKEALQQLYIIERTPEPEDLRDMPAVNLPRAVLQKVKRERDDGSRIKPEPHAKRHKYTTTIDLTGDSSDVEDNVIVLD